MQALHVEIDALELLIVNSAINATISSEGSLHLRPPAIVARRGVLIAHYRTRNTRSVLLPWHHVLRVVLSSHPSAVGKNHVVLAWRAVHELLDVIVRELEVVSVVVQLVQAVIRGAHVQIGPVLLLLELLSSQSIHLPHHNRLLLLLLQVQLLLLLWGRRIVVVALA